MRRHQYPSHESRKHLAERAFPIDMVLRISRISVPVSNNRDMSDTNQSVKFPNYFFSSSLPSLVAWAINSKGPSCSRRPLAPHNVQFSILDSGGHGMALFFAFPPCPNAWRIRTEPKRTRSRNISSRSPAGFSRPRPIASSRSRQWPLKYRY